MKHYFLGPGKSSVVHGSPHFLRVPGCSLRPLCVELRLDKVHALYFEVRWVLKFKLSLCTDTYFWRV